MGVSANDETNLSEDLQKLLGEGPHQQSVWAPPTAHRIPQTTSQVELPHCELSH